MTNSKLFDPSLNFDDEEVQLYRAGVDDINATTIDFNEKNISSITPLFLKCKNVQRLYLSINQISKIENIPESVKELYLNANQITKIENISESVKELHLSKNQITKIENISESIQKLVLIENPVKTITKQALDIIKKNNTKVYGVGVSTLEVVDS